MKKRGLLLVNLGTPDAPRSREVMSSADRRALTQHYSEEVQKTAALIGRDLSSWLS